MINGRVYRVPVDAISIAAADTPQDFIVVTAPATMILLILGGLIGQSNRASDAQHEMLRVQMNRYATIGSGGTAITPAKTQVGDPAATFTAKRGTALGVTATLLHADEFNIFSGWPYEPTEDDMIVVPPSGLFAFTLPADATATMTMSGYMLVKEVG